MSAGNQHQDPQGAGDATAARPEPSDQAMLTTIEICTANATSRHAIAVGIDVGALGVADVARLLAGAAGRDRAVVIATHDDRLTCIATRVVSLADGRLVA